MYVIPKAPADVEDCDGPATVVGTGARAIVDGCDTSEAPLVSLNASSGGAGAGGPTTIKIAEAKIA